MSLHADSYVFRPLLPEDAPAFADAVRESSDTVGRWMSWAHPGYSLAEAAAWIAHCTEQREQESSYEFGIFDSASRMLVGGCGLHQFNRINHFCNLGYWVRESWQRRGAATARSESAEQVWFFRATPGSHRDRGGCRQ
jgi:ribosomal-protein-serine acetyltransferase